jgi:hypothetical protein
MSAELGMSYAGIWWNSALEALYILLTPDDDGHWPGGDGSYTIRFEGGDNPALHACAFWSLTLYSHPDMRLVPNHVPAPLPARQRRAHRQLEPAAAHPGQVDPDRPATRRSRLFSGAFERQPVTAWSADKQPWPMARC